MAARAVLRWVVPAALATIVTIAGMPAAVAVSRPSAPRSVAAKPGNTTVRVSWIAPLHNGGAPISGYAIQRALDSAGPWNTVKKVAATTFAWKNSGLTNGQRYYYRVRAHNVIGWGAASGVANAVPRTVPSAPQAPAATGGDGSATVSWTAPASSGGAPIDGYQLQLSADGLTWSNLPAGTQPELTVPNLQNGTSYQFQVRAHNVAGWGPVSTKVVAIPGLPLPPTGVTGQSIATGADFTWIPSATASPAITGYDVEWSSNPDVVWNLAHVSSSTTHYSLSSSFYGTTYYFRVSASNAVGGSDWSPTTSAVIGLAPGQVSNLTVTYYGNPLFANSVGWSPPTTGSPVQGYYVDRIVTEGPYVRVATVPASDFPSYYDGGATHTTDYWYRITPYNQVGAGTSYAVHFTTP